jgi:hypothetical protein
MPKDCNPATPDCLGVLPKGKLRFLLPFFALIDSMLFYDVSCLAKLPR